MVIIATVLAVLLTGSLVYCVLIVVATRRFLHAALPAPGVSESPCGGHGGIASPQCQSLQPEPDGAGGQPRYAGDV